MTIEDLVVRIRIEEDKRLAQKGSQVQMLAKANMVEYGESSKGFKANKGKDNAKVMNLRPRKGGVKKKAGLFIGKCYNCSEYSPKSGLAHARLLHKHPLFLFLFLR